MNWEELFARRAKHPVDLAALLTRLGFTKPFTIFHVVGTNGKGSVSHFLAAGLATRGHRVGLFTSPHLVHPNERITVNGQMISDADFARLCARIDAAGGTALNFFSITYLVAMLYFAEQQCAWVVLEAGIGGSHDATRTVPGEYGCVTSIALDHEALLGHTVELIAYDKAGIIHPAMTFFVPTSLDPGLRALFTRRASTGHLIDNAGATYQSQNELFARGILAMLGISAPPFRWPRGRCEVLDRPGRPRTIVDVAHNYAGMRATLTHLAAQHCEFSVVVLALRRTKTKTGVTPLFAGKQLWVYAPTADFYSAAELGGTPLHALAPFVTNQAAATLYIGSFTLAGAVLTLYG